MTQIEHEIIITSNVFETSIRALIKRTVESILRLRQQRIGMLRRCPVSDPRVAPVSLKKRQTTIFHRLLAEEVSIVDEIGKSLDEFTKRCDTINPQDVDCVISIIRTKLTPADDMYWMKGEELEEAITEMIEQKTEEYLKIIFPNI